MKSYCILYFLLSISIFSFAQKDYSGVYGVGTKERTQYLTIFKIDSAHYKFWAIASGKDYTSSLTGVFEIKGDSIQYDYAENNKVCPVHFRFSGKYAVLYHEPTADCSFPFGSHIFTTYPFIQKQKIKPSNYIKEYISYQTYRVAAKKISFYTNTNESEIRNAYFMKGIKVIAPPTHQPSANMVYVEYLASTGEFIYGWVKKTDVKLID